MDLYGHLFAEAPFEAIRRLPSFSLESEDEGDGSNEDTADEGQ